MNLDDIKQILELVREHDLAEFELERDGLKVRIRKAGQAIAFAPAPVALAAPAVAAPPSGLQPVAVEAAPAAVAASAADDAVNLAVVKSPIVGTFYRASDPTSRPFVEVGDTVKKGQVLCIIEAMKLMNEIEADCDGEVAAVYVDNAKPVQFGDRLFAIKVN